MPVLNGGEYFKISLESVQKQSLKNIEIIIVDGGSTDGTLDYISIVSKDDARIRLIKSSKKSMGYQYNLGINHSGGKYIGFVEADDFVSQEMLETLYAIGTANGADIIKADWYSFTSNTKVVRKVVDDESLYDVLLDKVPSNAFIEVGELGHWSGIYRRDYIINSAIYFNETEGASFQDVSFYFLTYALGGSAYFVKKTFYNYRKDNPNSSIHNDIKSWCYPDEFEFTRNALIAKNIFSEYGTIFARFFFYRYIWAMRRLNTDDQVIFLNKFKTDYGFLFEHIEVNRIREVFTQDEYTIIENVVKYDSEEYFTMIQDKKKQYICELSRFPIVIIVGKSVAARWIMTILNGEHLNMSNITSDELDNYTEHRETAMIIIAAKSKPIEKEIIAVLQLKHFLHYSTIPLWLF